MATTPRHLNLACAALAAALAALFLPAPAAAYGWPLDDAARVALRTVSTTDVSSVELVRFVLFGSAALAAFQAAARDLGLS